MKKLNAIDSETSNLICSAQVITCLENAIKELIETSIDAGATTIEIKLTEFGTEMISVIDNACGISMDQQANFGKRHHTSKISNFEDIENAQSFGFRGEAIRYFKYVIEFPVCSWWCRDHHMHGSAFRPTSNL